VDGQCCVNSPHRSQSVAAMRTVGQARETAVALLAMQEVPVVLVDSNTEEFDAGWVFYYQSARYMVTKQLGDVLTGNAPIFVPRNGASPDFISYHRPTAESVEAFVCCGNANAAPNSEVELFGWEKGALKVSAIQAIRDRSPLGLAAVKEAVDTCLSGSPARVPTKSVAVARELASRLAGLGFVARVTYGMPVGA
jgi:hypothetical protein